MLDIFANCIGIAVYIFEGYCIGYLFDAFVKPKVSWHVSSKYTVGIFWFLVRIACRMFFSSDTGVILVEKLFIYMAFLFVFTMFMYKDSLMTKTLVVVLYTAVHELTFFAAYSILYICGFFINMLLLGLDKQLFTDDTFLFLVRIAVVFVTLLEAVLQAALLLHVIKRIVGSYRKREGIGREVFYYLLPAIAGILVSLFIRLILYTVNDGKPELLYNKYPALYIIIPSISIVLLLTIVYSFKLYNKITELHDERAERVILENQIVQMQNQVMEMEHLYDKAKGVRHDLKNHMMVLRELIGKIPVSDSGLDKEMIKYFQDMDLSIKQLDDRAYTGNPVSDAIIGNKFRYAEDKISNLRLDAEYFIVPEEQSVKAYDIGIILNNGLDNAIEACMKMREKYLQRELYISIRSFSRGKMFFIEIENSFDGIVSIDEESGYPISTKKDKEVHGIGLKNIRNCARKYAGDMDCIILADKFILSVMLKTQ